MWKRGKTLVPSRITNLPNIGDLLWRLYTYNLGHILVLVCELAKSAYFRSASAESDNKLFSGEGLGTRLPLDTLTCLKPMTI